MENEMEKIKWGDIKLHVFTDRNDEKKKIDFLSHLSTLTLSLSAAKQRFIDEGVCWIGITFSVR